MHPTCVYASVSGFGSVTSSPYRDRPAFAAIVEAMSGIYEMKRVGDEPPLASPVGALGDISASLFAVVGILAALRERDRTGLAQHVDVAMFDSVIAMTDIVANFWSMGLKNGDTGPVINHGFRAEDGWFVVQVGREHHFERLAEIVGRPEWATDPRLADRQGWMDHLETVLRPAIEQWARDKTRDEACEALGGSRHRRRSVPARRGAGDGSARRRAPHARRHRTAGWRGATGARCRATRSASTPLPVTEDTRRALGGRADGRDPPDRARSSR